MFERRYNWLRMSQRRLLEYPDRKIFLDSHCSTCQSFIEFTIHSCKIASAVLISPSRFIQDLPDKQRMYPIFLLCTYQFFFSALLCVSLYCKLQSWVFVSVEAMKPGYNEVHVVGLKQPQRTFLEWGDLRHITFQLLLLWSVVYLLITLFWLLVYLAMLPRNFQKYHVRKQ